MTENARIIQFPPRQTDGATWEPWVDEATIARHFGASARTVRRWRTLGMPSRLIGGLRRYRLTECETWHQSRERSAS